MKTTMAMMISRKKGFLWLAFLSTAAEREANTTSKCKEMNNGGWHNDQWASSSVSSQAAEYV